MTVEVYHDPSPDFGDEPVSVIMFLHYRLLHRSILLHHLLSFSFFLADYFSLLLSFSHSLILFPLLFPPLATRPISSHHGLGAYSHTSSHRPCLAPPPPLTTTINSQLLWFIKQPC
ncbi:hypothetical protein NW759_004624 [Fusarium solani]|nr:hypothetical protein NW759_004624 [Fusarium solani]